MTYIPILEQIRLYKLHVFSDAAEQAFQAVESIQ